MQSIQSIFKIGLGPSSSHSMGPARAAQLFAQALPQNTDHLAIELYGSLAATGKGHLTDTSIESALGSFKHIFAWIPEINLPLHPNGMIFKAFDKSDTLLDSKTFYSIGGGELLDGDGKKLGNTAASSYKLDKIDDIMKLCISKDIKFWQYVEESEPQDIWNFLSDVWNAMKLAVKQGISSNQKILPGGLNLARKAQDMLIKANERVAVNRDLNLVSAYALAVAEENAGGGQVVTAPTCGSCGVLPATLYYMHKYLNISEKQILRALATAALFGNSVATNASISGAEVGCQGEIGTACSMASAALAQIMDGSLQQIEYAAEMGLEHFLGLTCDPVDGLVQIPCIERNAFAAMRAFECAIYATATDGKHLVSFDDVVDVMNKTGKDLQSDYRETALGGLAKVMQQKRMHCTCNIDSCPTKK